MKSVWIGNQPWYRSSLQNAIKEEIVLSEISIIEFHATVFPLLVFSTNNHKA